MKIKKKELAELIQDVYRQAYTVGANTNELENEVKKKTVQLSELREEHRILKRTAEQAEAKAATLEKMLEDERAAMEKLENTLSKFAKHNKMLHDKLEAAGIEAPTFAQFLAIQNLEGEEEGEE